MFKELTPADIRTTRSSLNQLVDVPQEVISSSLNRQDHLNFVTSSANSLTSSLFVTVFDQDKSLQTANSVFDITVGTYISGSDIQLAKTGESADGLVLFPSNLTMNREKTSIYREFASYLLGDPDYFFTAPYVTPGTSYSAPTGGLHSTSTRRIDYALFVAFKRLFVRDSVKRETLAFKIYSTAALDGKFGDTKQSSILNGFTGSNLYRVTPSGSNVYGDTSSATSLLIAPDGSGVGNIYSTTNTSYAVGTMFYDKGIAVFDMEKVFANQHMSGAIRSVLANGGAHTDVPSGYYPLGDIDTANFSLTNPNATFFPDLMLSASIQDIVDHVCSTRFSSSNATAITFQNQTDVNSMLVFCRAAAGEFNYSSNPTYVDTDGRLVVIEPGQEGVQQSFSFITTVGLHNEVGQLLAVAKLSRPLLKDAENDLVIRTRIDW
jgi:hypothetical protein